jgi:hypothetical protein
MKFFLIVAITTITSFSAFANNCSQNPTVSDLPCLLDLSVSEEFTRVAVREENHIIKTTIYELSNNSLCSLRVRVDESDIINQTYLHFVKSPGLNPIEDMFRISTGQDLRPVEFYDVNMPNIAPLQINTDGTVVMSSGETTISMKVRNGKLHVRTEGLKCNLSSI